MPDLPLDTLVILGLILASLIGRIFQKKENPESKPSGSSPTDDPPDEENSLEDILRKAWAGEEELEQEAFPEELVSQAEEIPEAVAPAILATPSTQAPAKVSPKPKKQPVKTRKTNWVRHELGSSKGSLRKAFVLKEVLDKPVSLR
ncbi:MAG: hypothetical protein VX969_07380, partial [Verrucomicrobiota bacterium]|nr:hypothetical protein [Verrucomicrobiota bacterium]